MSRISSIVQSKNDLESETVTVPQWGVDIEVRGFDGFHRAEFISRLSEARESGDDMKLADVELDLIILCAFDPEDESQAFEEGDKTWLMSKSGAAIGTLSEAAMRVCGLDTKAEERLGKGSSSATPTGDSSSGSPTN